MIRLSFSTLLIVFSLIVLSSCRTDQPMFAGAVYTGVPALIVAIAGIIYVLKKVL